MKRHFAIIIVLTLCAIAAALYIGRFIAPDVQALASIFTPRLLMLLGGWTKLLALITAATFAFRATAALGHDNPAHLPWRLLAWGLTAYALGQATLVAYQSATGVSPFPSIGDIFFLASYPLLITALIQFTVAYSRSGFPMTGVAPLAIVTPLVAVAVAWPLLAPIARTPAPGLERFLNLAYPFLDLLLLVPAVVLLGVTIRFRGGAVWRIWAALLAGVVFTILGDIGFAWFTSMGVQHIDPLVHAVYILAYGSLALGTNVQYRLVRPEAHLPAALATA